MPNEIRLDDRLTPIWFYFLNHIAVTIVNECCLLSIDGDRCQLILDVERLGVGQSIFHAGNHIPIGVVSMGLAGTEGGHRVFVGKVIQSTILCSFF